MATTTTSGTTPPSTTEARPPSARGGSSRSSTRRSGSTRSSPPTRSTTSSALRWTSGSATSASQISRRCRVRRRPRDRSSAGPAGASCVWPCGSPIGLDHATAEPNRARARMSGDRARFLRATCDNVGRLREARMARRRWFHGLTPPEWRRLAGFGGGILLLHVLGWGFFLYYSRRNPALARLGTLAYTFG